MKAKRILLPEHMKTYSAQMDTAQSTHLQKVLFVLRLVISVTQLTQLNLKELRWNPQLNDSTDGGACNIFKA